MKIIKPIDITEDKVSSNAPPTNATQWDVEGRDFSRDFGTCLISASDTKVYTLNSNSSVFLNSVKVQTVATGDTEFLTLTDMNMSVQSLQVNKDNTYIAIIGTKTGTSPIIQVYSLSTGIRVYERTDVSYSGNFGLGIQFGYKWSNDSSTLAFWAKPTPVVEPKNDSEPVIIAVSTTGFTETISDSTLTDYRTDMGTITGTVYNSTIDLVFDDTDSTIYAFGISTTGYGITTKYIFIKMTVSTGVSVGAIVTKNITMLVYNPTRDEIIGVNAGVGGLINVFSTSLVEQVDKPNLSGVVRNSYARISHLSGPNALYVRDFSKDVGYVLYSMTDYSSVTDLDPTEELLIADETTGYYVTQESSGFGLFDSTTLVEVTSNNPSVIAGNIYTYNGRVYEVLTNNTDRPDLGALLDPPTWLDLGVVNPLRMFDGKLDSLTASTSPLVVEITPNVIVNGIAIFNINATTVQITMNAPTDGLVYDSGVIDLVDSGTITGWYEFFFGQRLQKFDLVKTDLPTYPSATITINAIGGDDITVGEIVVGKIQNIGDAQYGTSVGIIDFSRKEADQFGIFSIVKRRFSKRAEYDIKIPTGQNSGVQRTLADFRTTPLVWVGDENKLETVVYGYYRNFDILIAGPSLSDCTITVEGL